MRLQDKFHCRIVLHCIVLSTFLSLADLVWAVGCWLDVKFGFGTNIQNTRAVPSGCLWVKIVWAKRRRQKPHGSVSARNIVAWKCSAFMLKGPTVCRPYWHRWRHLYGQWLMLYRYEHDQCPKWCRLVRISGSCEMQAFSDTSWNHHHLARAQTSILDPAFVQKGFNLNWESERFRPELNPTTKRDWWQGGTLVKGSITIM
jgi:hypothetical protein